MLRLLPAILRHPLNRHNPIAALRRFAAWQLGTRLLGAAVAVPFVGSTRLLVRRGMHGATGNVYCGLHEYEDMAFVLHALRADDLFVDVGANVGSYTILAAGAAGARCVSVEPIPSTFNCLLDNLRLNDLGARVDAHNIGLGRATSFVEFTADLDTVNHALVDTKDGAALGRAFITVPVRSLDDLLAERAPTVIKIDVEGFESAVLDGAPTTLRSPQLLAVLMELNGSGTRYGFSDDSVHERMLALGFIPGRYEPRHRALRELATAGTGGGNTLYVKHWSVLQTRLTQAPSHAVLDTVV